MQIHPELRTLAEVKAQAKRRVGSDAPPIIDDFDEKEALAMAQDAIRLVVEDMTARGEPIPTASTPRIREITVTLAA